MIAFATLFLGLVFGPVQVEMIAAHGVARVELVLDGVVVAQVTEPWRATLDLGPVLAPHELVAVARDASGRELARARQWVNRPRAAAEAEFVLEPGSGGARRVARLTWRCVTREDPLSVSVSFDGRPLAAPFPSRIVLPRHVPEQLHFLRAELDFGGDVRAVADATFGGGRKAETLTNLTAVPILLGPARRPPTVPELRDAFTVAGTRATPAAVEEGPAEVVFVMAGRTADELARIEGRFPSRTAFRLGRDEVYRLVWCHPLTSTQRDQEITVFPMSPDVARGDAGVLFYAARLTGPEVGSKPLVSQALATAALSAAARDRRRAVVLVVGPDASDAGTLPAEEARAFLERLHVPLFVWSVAKEPSPLARRFGPVVDASTWDRFGDAVKALAAHLDRQRIVWLEGTWLPQAVALGGTDRGFAIAR